MKYNIIISPHIYNMEGKSSTQNAHIRRFFYADLPIDNARLLVPRSDLEFFYH